MSSHPTGAPVVAVDVDGVLNPHSAHRAAALGYQPHAYDGPGPDGRHVTGTVWLHPAHGGWLRELTDAGAQLVWNTSWGHLAATWVAPRLDLPGDLVVVEHRATGVAWGRQAKLDSLYSFTGDRPVAVLDDEHGGKDHGRADDRTAAGTVTLLVAVDPFDGLRRADIEVVRRWLHDTSNPPTRS